jgi:hypothetical protein
LGALIGNYTRYLEEINIREDKLLLYHCLLELGSPKVNVSEQQYCVSFAATGIFFKFKIINRPRVVHRGASGHFSCVRHCA